MIIIDYYQLNHYQYHFQLILVVLCEIIEDSMSQHVKMILAAKNIQYFHLHYISNMFRKIIIQLL